MANEQQSTTGWNSLPYWPVGFGWVAAKPVCLIRVVSHWARRVSTQVVDHAIQDVFAGVKWSTIHTSMFRSSDWLATHPSIFDRIGLPYNPANFDQVIGRTVQHVFAHGRLYSPAISVEYFAIQPSMFDQDGRRHTAWRISAQVVVRTAQRDLPGERPYASVLGRSYQPCSQTCFCWRCRPFNRACFGRVVSQNSTAVITHVVGHTAQRVLRVVDHKA